MRSFTKSTEAYEAWRGSRAPIVTADLELKHERLRTSPFVFLRGTYYRFLEQFVAGQPELAKAPAVVAVGDLHIENFGTWRDHDARLVWGVNDFDEADLLPYTIDLARLATSALLAIEEGHMAIDAADACEALLDGWRERVEGGQPSRSCSASSMPTCTSSPPRRSRDREPSRAICTGSPDTTSPCPRARRDSSPMRFRGRAGSPSFGPARPASGASGRGGRSRSGHSPAAWSCVRPSRFPGPPACGCGLAAGRCAGPMTRSPTHAEWPATRGAGNGASGSYGRWLPTQPD